MIAYNTEWLDALLTKDAAEDWCDEELISEETEQAIKAHYPSRFYSPNVFARIGLAVFSFILIYAVLGLGFLAAGPQSEEGIFSFGIFWGVVLILALELWIIRSLRHFGSGIDDMTLYIGTVTLIGSIYVVFPFSFEMLPYCCVAWPFLVAGSIRYLDRLMTAAAFGCSFLIVLLSVSEIPKLALYLLPFSGMLFSAAAFFFARRAQRREGLRHWAGQFTVIELLALPSFYASGNYFIVQQSGNAWFEIAQPPIAWFFWAFTFGVPVLYVFWGLRQKDRIFLDIGIACAAAAVFTFRFYHHVLPLAWACTVIGAILALVAYFSIRYLQKNAGAYTYTPDANKLLLQDLEEQIIAQTIAVQSPHTPAPNDTFGGGDFGGGGAGGDY